MVLILIWGEGKIGSQQRLATRCLQQNTPGRMQGDTGEDFKGHSAQRARGWGLAPFRSDNGGVHRLQEALPVPRRDAQPPAVQAGAF